MPETTPMREGDGEDLQPVAEQVEIDRAPGPEPQPLEHREIAREPDREGGKDEVEGDGEGELHPGEEQGGVAVGHAQGP